MAQPGFAYDHCLGCIETVQWRGRSIAIRNCRFGTRNTRRPGCDHYALSVDIDDPNLIHVSERWRDQAALGTHLVSDHVVAFQMSMRRTRILRGDVKIYYPDGSIKKLIDV
jgi:quinol monooxygenase YgiN